MDIPGCLHLFDTWYFYPRADAMIQNIYIPKNAQLRQVVNFLSYVEITPADPIEGWTAIFPNATSNLILSLDDPIQVNNTAVDSSIYASCSSTIAFRPYQGMKFMTVQFNSYGLSYFGKLPANELFDTLITLDMLFLASELEALKNQIWDVATVAEKFKILEAFLIHGMDNRPVDPRLPFALSLLKSKKTLRIDALSKRLELSNRGLQKLFKKHLGMRPILYIKINRFNQVANALLHQKDTSLTQIAYSFGYYDQAHFIKDFKKFGEISPSEFLHLKARSSDFYNYNLKDLDSLEA